MANKFKVGDRVRCIDASDSTLRVGATYVVDRAEVDYVYVKHPLSDLIDGGWQPNRFELAPIQTLTAEDGTKHNAVALSAVLVVIDKIAKEWAPIHGEADPEYVREDIQRIRTGVCKLFGYMEDPDET